MPEFTEVKDSGEREDFDTGSVRDSRAGKGRYDLLSPWAMRRLARHTENGAAKYGDRNWELGQPMSRNTDSAIRHIFNFLEGERSEDHLAAAVWNLMAIMHFEETLPEDSPLRDLPWMQPPPMTAEEAKALLRAARVR